MKRRPPIYVMNHGIEVLAEYAPSSINPYWRLRIRTHPFFPKAKSVSGAILVRRSRVVMSAELGREIRRDEHVHHKSGDRTDDAPANLEILEAAEHNRHHKLGSKHSDESRSKISAGMKEACADRLHRSLKSLDWTGRRHSDESKAKMSAKRKELIERGQMARPRPPSPKGRKQSDETREKMSKARRAWWARQTDKRNEQQEAKS